MIGIPESTLRYYDDQMLPAMFLYSLRLASIPMAEVRADHQDPPSRFFT